MGKHRGRSADDPIDPRDWFDKPYEEQQQIANRAKDFDQYDEELKAGKANKPKPWR